MRVVNKIKMDLLSKQNVQTIHAVGGDTNSRHIQIELFEGGVPWVVPTNSHIAIAYLAANGANGIYDTLPSGADAYIYDENKISFILVPAALYPGITKITLVVSDESGDQISTFPLIIDVDENYSYDASEPENYINLRQWMDEELAAMIGELEIPKPLICTVTGSDAAGYSCDTSWAQIKEAADQGRVVLARISYTFYYLRFITHSYAEFTHISGEYSGTLTIYSDGSAPTIETVTLAQGASTALPTPTAEDAGKVPVVKEDGSGYALGNKVELIKSITIGDDAEEANALTIDADEDGNPFELVYARLQSYFPKYTGTSEIPNFSYTMVNGYTHGQIYPAVYTSGFPVVSSSQPRSSIYVMDTRGPQLYEYGFRSNVNAALFGGLHSDSRTFYRGPENFEYFSPITSIGGINMLIYPGCKFELWGVRK